MAERDPDQYCLYQAQCKRDKSLQVCTSCMKQFIGEMDSSFALMSKARLHAVNTLYFLTGGQESGPPPPDQGFDTSPADGGQDEAHPSAVRIPRGSDPHGSRPPDHDPYPGPVRDPNIPYGGAGGGLPTVEGIKKEIQDAEASKSETGPVTNNGAGASPGGDSRSPVLPEQRNEGAEDGGGKGSGLLRLEIPKRPTASGQDEA